jgi:hypothetical protein
MAEVFGNFQTITGIDRFEKTYEANRWTRQEVLAPQIQIEDVLATQALVMRILGQQHRSVLRGDKKHGFATLNSINTSQDEYYDGSLEDYVACRVAKVEHDRWKMRIRFRQNELSEEQNDCSYVDDYAFDWLRNGNLQAWQGSYVVKATPEGTYEAWRDIQPIDTLALAGLHDQLRRHVELSTESRMPRSFNDRSEN